MPTYEFRCPDGHEFERFYRKISDGVSEVACPVCGKTATRQMSAGAGLLFKGSGFYLTDYGKNAHRGSGGPEASKSSDGGSSSESKGEGKSSDAKSSESKSSDSKPSESKSTESKSSESKSSDSKPASSSTSSTSSSSSSPKSDK